MWSNNDGNAEGGNSGAGFMNSPSQFASPAQKKERRTQNLVPVTIKMIEESGGDSVSICDTEVHMLILVGIIRSVEMSSTKITYSIDDSTGVIEGVLWMESDSEFEEEKKPLMEMTYCKVVGSLRLQQGKRHIMIFNIVPLTDINRLTTHILEVIHAPMKLQQLQTLRISGGSSNAARPSASTNSAGDQVVQPRDQGNNQGLTGSSKLVYQMIKMTKDDIGISKNQMLDGLQGKVSAQAIHKILDDLSSEGLIFCSIDEEHFKTSENF